MMERGRRIVAEIDRMENGMVLIWYHVWTEDQYVHAVETELDDRVPVMGE